MTWYPIAFLPPQYEDSTGQPYHGAVLKAYAAGTTTPITMATTYEGTTTAGSFMLNSSGYPVSGGAVIIPHVQEDYKLALYPNQASADANSGAVWTYDNIKIAEVSNEAFVQSFSGDGTTTSFTLSEDLGDDERTVMVFADKKFGEYSTNGTFDADSNWTKGSGWTIGSGVATATGAISTDLTQSAAIPLIEGESYTITYTITRSAGGVIPKIGGKAGTERTSSGTYTETIIAGSTQAITFSGNGFTGTVDAVSVHRTTASRREILRPDEFTLDGVDLDFDEAPAAGTSNIIVYAPSLLFGAVNSLVDAAATSEANAAASADLAEDWATKTSGDVDGSEYSSKAYAIGGTGITNTAGKGAAKHWAITTGGTVDGTDFSAKEHAVGTSVTTGSAKDWAMKTAAAVVTGLYSAKEWAQGILTRGAAGGGSAKDWANYTGGTVDNTEYSAKKYAQDASASASAAATAETNAETAETNAETAQAGAEAAQTAAEAAQTAAEAAQAAAETAETNAAASETNAASSASAASTSATNASNSASAAATSATNASNSASAAATAETNAETAETNAETAQAGAEAAQTAAEAAQTAAEAAQAAAETAETNAAASETAAAASAADAQVAKIEWQGTYNPLTAYELNDAVEHNGSSFICIQAGTGQTPVVGGTAYWDDLAVKGADGIGSGDLLAANNLSDVADTGTSRTNLGVGTGDSPQFAAVNIGHASDTTLTRVSAGVAAIEGSNILLASGLGSITQAYNAGLADIAGLAKTDSNIIVGNGTNWVAESGATARTSLGLGTADTVQFTGINLGHASDTTITRVSAGVIAVEGSNVLLASGLGSITQAYNSGLADIASLAKTDSNIIVGNGTNWVAESGATARTSLGLGTADSPQFTGINVGHASDTTITRISAGNIAVEGNAVYRAGGTDVPIADGGTGRSSHTAYAVICGGTTGTGAQQSIADVGTSGQILTSNGAGALPTFQDAPATITLGTKVETTSGTSIDFTSIPSGTKRITISFDGVSTNGTSNLLVQLGDSGGVETSGYLGSICLNTNSGSTIINPTTGIGVTGAWASTLGAFGHVILTLIDASTNQWAASVNIGITGAAQSHTGGATKSLSATLDRVRITTTNGTDAFDAGAINISYE